MGQTIHVAITKERLIKDIRELGPQEVLADAKGMTVADAVGMIEQDGREVFTLGECDNYDDRGRCQGHPQQLGCVYCNHLACICDIRRDHKEDCRYRVSATCAVPIECEHGHDVCPKCDPCTCDSEAPRSD